MGVLFVFGVYLNYEVLDFKFDMLMGWDFGGMGKKCILYMGGIWIILVRG